MSLTTTEDGAAVAIFAPAEAAAANPGAAVLVGLVANPAVVVGVVVAMPLTVALVVAKPAVVAERVAAKPVVVAAVVEMIEMVEMVVNTGHTGASFGAVPPLVVRLTGAPALHRLLLQPCLLYISRNRWRWSLTKRLICVIG